MDPYEAVFIYHITFLHINVLVMTLAFNVAIYVKAKKDQLLYSFLFLQGTMMLWMIAKIFKTVSPFVEPRWFFIVLQYFAICLLEVGFFEFAHIYANRKRAQKKYRYLLYILATVQCLVVATNPYHHLFYSEFDFWGDEFGVLFYVHTVIIYSVLTYGIVLCGIKLRQTIKSRIQYRIISIAVLFPFISNFLYIAGVTKKFIRSLGFQVTFDVTPIAFTLSLFIFLFAIYRYDFLDLMPIYKEEIIRRIQTAIIVTDQEDVVIECNNEAKKLMGFDQMEDRRSLKDYLQEIVDSSNARSLMGELSTIENDKIEWSYDGKVYEIHKKPYLDTKEVIKGYIYTIYDISEYIEVKESIKDKNEAIMISNEVLKDKIDLSTELSHIAARNYFARELHDILGHSMTLAIKLLEVASLSYEEERDIALEQLKEAAKVSSRGYQDLRKSVVDNFEAKHDFRGLKNDIKKLAKILEVAGVTCSVELNKDYGFLSVKESQVIKRFCQEGITNALKHGKATELKITLDFDKGGNEVTCLNNGIKPSGISKGNGLKGIDYRVSQIGGSVSIVDDGKWFGMSMTY